MCPNAEQLLGRLNELGYGPDKVVPLAFHVDYFDKPWKDPLSAKAYSEREASYNFVMKRTDLYFTPMLMIDGKAPMLGTNLAEAKRALSATSKTAPGASLDLNWDAKDEGPSRNLKVTIAAKSASSGRRTLVGIALYEDKVVTKVLSGENAGKTLTDRYAVRSYVFENVKLKSGEKRTLTIPITLPTGANPANAGVGVFAQDWADGRIHQAASIPWIAPKSK